MSFQVHSFSNDGELARDAAAQWLAVLRNRKDSAHKRYCVAISGGRIARTFFSEIVRQAGQGDAGAGGNPLFENVHFFWADERCVPPDDAENNYGMARQILLEPLKIPADRIHRLRGEGPEALALREAVSDICGVAPMANGQPVLDLIFLGMGEDGHVASLFPGEPDEVMGNGAVYRAVTAVKPPPRRLTLGYAAIAAALEVWVVAAGAGKQEALRQSLSPGGKTPLARVLSQREQTRIFTDISLA